MAIFWNNCEGQQHTCPKQKTLLENRHKVHVICSLHFQKILLHDINNYIWCAMISKLIPVTYF